MNTWFRMYNEVVNDPKVQRLPPLLFKAWINMLCLASNNGGELPPIEDVAFALHVTQIRAEGFINELTEVGLLEDRNGVFVPHNWNGRQFQSDGSTERVKRFRKQQRNVSSGVTETGPDTDTEQRQIQNRGKGNSRGLKTAATRPRDLASDHFAAKCKEFSDTPYDPGPGDFVMLAKLRKVFSTPALEMPPGWEGAVENYFASPLGQYSLADLANPKRYAVFKNSPLDKFNKPIHHEGNNGHDSKSLSVQRQINAQHQAVESMLDRTANSARAGDESAKSPALLARPEPPH